MNIIIIDNYDSFTYNLAYMVKQITGSMPVVKRNDKVTLEEIDYYDKILLSPGPGIPSEAGLLLPVIKQYAPKKSILGVCLGHQAIGEVFAARLINMREVYHGVATTTYVNHTTQLFTNMPSAFDTGRYHSWTIDPRTIGNELQVLAADDKGNIMAIKHMQYEVYGVQFHPESILTPEGKQIIENWINT